MHIFIVGQEYERQRLLDFVGSRQMQSGVLWGTKEPGCLICTSGGRGGKKAGYSDELQIDGSWWYFGQGMTGNQSLMNAANAKLSSGKLSVLLFTTREPTARDVAARGGYGKLFAFRGDFNVVGFEPFVPNDGNRKGDKLWRFRLAPIGNDSASSINSEEGIPIDLQEMQRRFSEHSSAGFSGFSLQEYRCRSAAVHLYATQRAGGHCEACRLPAPFSRPDGRAFLEVHHMTRLADDGPDLPSNVAALCPNCHRRAHYASDRLEFGRVLREHIALLEKQIASG